VQAAYDRARAPETRAVTARERAEAALRRARVRTNRDD
jgi:hypothetical protein